MAETSEGWDGTVDEAAIARILAAAAPPRIDGFTVNAVPGQRRVICTAGESHYAFIRYETDEGGIFDLPAPTQGRWHLLVQRRDWGSNTVSMLTIPGAETAGALLPDVIPSAYPVGFTDSPGISADIPIAWVWVRSTDTTTIVFPITVPNRFESATPGLVAIHPSSVSNATLAADGTIVLDNVSDKLIDIFGLFSSRFRNYRMLSRFTSKQSVGIDLECINGSTPIATASYFSSTQAWVNSVRQDGYAGANQWMINLISLFSGAQAGAAVDIFTPNEAARTTFHGNVFATGGVMSNAVTLASLETSDVVTGLRIRIPAGAQATGTLKFYGYA